MAVADEAVPASSPGPLSPSRTSASKPASKPKASTAGSSSESESVSTPVLASCLTRGSPDPLTPRDSYANFWQPFPAYWTIFWGVIVILFNGWEVFTAGSWNASDFVVAYINLPLFAILAGGYWLVKRPKHLKPSELDFVSNIPSDEEVYYEEPPPKNIFQKIGNWLFT